MTASGFGFQEFSLTTEKRLVAINSYKTTSFSVLGLSTHWEFKTLLNLCNLPFMNWFNVLSFPLMGFCYINLEFHIPKHIYWNAKLQVKCTVQWILRVSQTIPSAQSQSLSTPALKVVKVSLNPCVILVLNRKELWVIFRKMYVVILIVDQKYHLDKGAWIFHVLHLF